MGAGVSNGHFSLPCKVDDRGVGKFFPSMQTYKIINEKMQILKKIVDNKNK